MSLLDDAIGKAEALLQELKDAKATGIVEPDEPIETAAPAVDAEQVRVAEEGHDNELPFKCPACGKTFEEQVPCTNGHQPEPTLPTAEVLAGAPPAEQTAATEPQVNQAVVESTPVAPTIAAVPDAAPQDPPWPAGTA